MSRLDKPHLPRGGPAPVDRPIRVGVVAGYALLLEALRQTFEERPELETVNVVRKPAQAVDLVQKKAPDAVLLVHTGPSLDELDIISRIVALDRPTKILVLSSDATDHAALRMLRAGAHGILSPSATTDEMIDALRTVTRGELYLTPHLQRVCAERYLGVDTGGSPQDQLSDREYQVMRLLALGNTNREIAAQLGVGVKTIDTHRANLLRKLGLRNNADVTRFAIRNGVVDS